MKFLYLTEAQADQVRGDYGFNRLEPVAYDGGYVLNVAVLDEPAFADVMEVLEALPVVEVA